MCLLLGDSVTLNRQDAIKLFNVVAAQLAPVALGGLDLEAAMICVWSVYADKLGAGRALCEQRGTVLTEEEVMGLGVLWQTLWGMDPDTRPAVCPLCAEPKPVKNAHFICSCLLAKSTGKYIDYHIPGRIAEIATRHPGTWRNITAEAFACQTCEKVCEVSLGQVADIFNRGRSWRTPSYCRACAHAYFEEQKKLAEPETPTDPKGSIESMGDLMALSNNET